MTHPRLWHWISDDFRPAADQWQPDLDERFWYVLGRDGETVLGLGVFEARSSILLEGHCCLLPCAWGRTAEIAAGCFAWLFSRTTACRIAAAIASDNRLALKMARSAGMQECGRHPLAFLRGGKLHDLILLGISREGLSTCQQ
jgi:RimJ/RimL family protein N-acetyltransferase